MARATKLTILQYGESLPGSSSTSFMLLAFVYVFLDPLAKALWIPVRIHGSLFYFAHVTA